MYFILTDGRAWYKQIVSGIFLAIGVVLVLAFSALIAVAVFLLLQTNAGLAIVYTIGYILGFIIISLAAMFLLFWSLDL